MISSKIQRTLLMLLLTSCLTNALALPLIVDNETSEKTPISTLEQAQKKLVRLLALAEQQPEQVEKLSAEAEQLAVRYCDDALLQSLWQRLSRYTDWQPVNAIINSAGIDFASVQGWQPESPFIRVRRALLPPVAENEHIIFADNRLVLLMTNENALKLEVDARLQDVAFLPESPTQLFYQVDDNPAQSLLLVDKADWQRFSLAIPAGEHAVRFYQQHYVGNQYIKLRFFQPSGVISVAQQRPYFISTNAIPFEFYSQGATVLRIDELKPDGVSYRYQSVPEGWQTIRLSPTDGKPRSLFRVSQRALNLKPEALHNRIVQRQLSTIAAPLLKVPEPVVAKKVELIDVFKLGKQEDGTFSVGLDLVRRNDQQNVVGGTSTQTYEQFVQQRINYRYYDEPNHVYWNSLGFFRVREHGSPSFGIQQTAYYNPYWLPFNVTSNAKLIAQVPQNQIAVLAQWDISVSNAYYLHPKTRLIPSLSYFARAMSLRNRGIMNSDPIFKQKVDMDIFTSYKADHTQGFTPDLLIKHTPWLDTLWTSKVWLATNENLSMDNVGTETHWLQLLGNVELDASYRSTFYQADANRNKAATRSYAGLALNWQYWQANQDRLEVGMQYTYDIERQAHLGMLSLTYHFGEGRGYRDFSPNEINFQDIHVRQRENEQNNVLRDINHD